RHQLHARASSVGVDDRRSAEIEAGRAGRIIERARIEREWVGASEPAGDCRLQPHSYRRTDIEEGNARRSQQVFERARRQKIDVRRFDIDWNGADGLIGIDEDQRTLSMGGGSDSL